MTIKHEYNGSGSHRLTAYDVPGRISATHGQWYGYNDIATMIIRGESFMAVTDYFDGKLAIKPNTVYRITEQESK